MEAGDTFLTFGKYKGEKIRDVSTGYLDWLLGADGIDKKNAITAYLKTQAEYDSGSWKDGREDYDPNEDD